MFFYLTVKKKKHIISRKKLVLLSHKVATLLRKKTPKNTFNLSLEAVFSKMPRRDIQRDIQRIVNYPRATLCQK